MCVFFLKKKFKHFIDVKSLGIGANMLKLARPLKADESLHLIAFLSPFHPCARTRARARTCRVRRMFHESSGMSLNAALVKWILRSRLLISGACLLTTECVQHRREREAGERSHFTTFITAT